MITAVACEVISVAAALVILSSFSVTLWGLGLKSLAFVSAQSEIMSQSFYYLEIKIFIRYIIDGDINLSFIC